MFCQEATIEFVAKIVFLAHLASLEKNTGEILVRRMPASEVGDEENSEGLNDQEQWSERKPETTSERSESLFWLIYLAFTEK